MPKNIKPLKNNVVLTKVITNTINGIYISTNEDSSIYKVVAIGDEVKVNIINKQVICKSFDYMYEDYYITSIDNILAYIEGEN